MFKSNSSITIPMTTKNGAWENSKKEDDSDNSDENSDIDVDWLLYCYTTILRRSEKDFWSSSPAMVFKQLDIHMELNRKASEQQSDKPEKKSSKQTYKVLD